MDPVGPGRGRGMARRSPGGRLARKKEQLGRVRAPRDEADLRVRDGTSIIPGVRRSPRRNADPGRSPAVTTPVWAKGSKPEVSKHGQWGSPFDTSQGERPRSHTISLICDEPLAVGCMPRPGAAVESGAPETSAQSVRARHGRRSAGTAWRKSFTSSPAAYFDGRGE